MATISYISVGPTIVGESTGGLSRAYGLDALGSVVATYTGTAVQNTYTYKPYGRVLAKTGTGGDPSFLWNGGSGYRATGLDCSEAHVRRRHYSSSHNSWTTCDPLWPTESPFSYLRGGVTRFSDPSGLAKYTLSAIPIANQKWIYIHPCNPQPPPLEFRCEQIYAWDLSPLDPSANGIIVQHVEVWDDSAVDALTYVCGQTRVKRKTSDLYEAWYVINGDVYCDAGRQCYGVDDRQLSVGLVVKGFCGGAMTTATMTAAFFSGESPSGWPTGKSTCCASGLHASFTAPPYWGSTPDSNILIANLQSSFECCTNLPGSGLPPPYCTQSQKPVCKLD